MARIHVERSLGHGKRKSKAEYNRYSMLILCKKKELGYASVSTLVCIYEKTQWKNKTKTEKEEEKRVKEYK